MDTDFANSCGARTQSIGNEDWLAPPPKLPSFRRSQHCNLAIGYLLCVAAAFGCYFMPWSRGESGSFGGPFRWSSDQRYSQSGYQAAIGEITRESSRRYESGVLTSDLGPMNVEYKSPDLLLAVYPMLLIVGFGRAVMMWSRTLEPFSTGYAVFILCVSAWIGMPFEHPAPPTGVGFSLSLAANITGPLFATSSAYAQATERTMWWWIGATATVTAFFIALTEWRRSL